MPKNKQILSNSFKTHNFTSFITKGSEELTNCGCISSRSLNDDKLTKYASKRDVKMNNIKNRCIFIKDSQLSLLQQVPLQTRKLLEIKVKILFHILLIGWKIWIYKVRKNYIVPVSIIHTFLTTSDQFFFSPAIIIIIIMIGIITFIIIFISLHILDLNYTLL